MALVHFKPEIWAAELIVQLRKSLVFAGPTVVNHNYEGQIQEAGDTVHISSVGAVSVGDYTGTVTYQDIDDAGLTLVIDQEKYWGVKVKDIDKAQSVNGGAVVAQLMSNAAYSLADVADQWVAGKYTDASASNVLDGSGYDMSTAGEAYNMLVDLGVLLDEADVPSEGRYAVIPPWFHGIIRKDPNFINANKSADGGQALRNGIVGEAAGFDLLKSNNCVVPSAGENVIMAGTPMAISFANQIIKTEGMRDPDSFSDLLRGLHVYGGKTIYSDGLAYSIATRP
jgi:hypothetical protein